MDGATPRDVLVKHVAHLRHAITEMLTELQYELENDPDASLIRSAVEAGERALTETQGAC